MLLSIVFLNVWGVLQLVALGSFARTVRVRTVLAAIATGLFFCAPLAAALEYTWASAIGASIGQPVGTVIAVTGYTVDPPIEEIIRILPIAFLLTVPAIRRQLSVTDCVLIGAAAGAGFGLAEDLYRFGSAPQYASAVPGGWMAGSTFIPDIGTSLFSWLPDLGVRRLFPPSIRLLPNVLLIWSALAGLAVGLVLRLRGVHRWYAAAALLAYVSADHAARNADITLGRELLVTAPLRAFRDLLPLLPLAALGAAWSIDRRWQRPVLPEQLLDAELEASTRAAGTLRAALTRPPESIAWVDRYVRLRRAFNIQRHSSTGETEDLRAALAGLREKIDDLLRQPGARPTWVASGNERAVARRRGRQTLIRIALLSPAVLWFVIGGWPETAGVQRALSAGVGWTFAVAVSLAAQARLLWTLLKAPNVWRRVSQARAGDLPAAFILRATTAVGVVGFGVYGAMRAFGLEWTSPAVSSAHSTDAAGSLPAEQALPMANSGSLPMKTGSLERDGNWLYDPATGQWYWDPSSAEQWAAEKAFAYVLKVLLGLVGGVEWVVGNVINMPDDNRGRSRQPGYGSDDVPTDERGKRPPE